LGLGIRVSELLGLSKWHEKREKDNTKKEKKKKTKVFGPGDQGQRAARVQ
jgi:hypothetical protein